MLSFGGLTCWLGVADDARGGGGRGSRMLSDAVGRGAEGTTGVFGEVGTKSESEIAALPAELLRERRLLLFGGVWVATSSPPLVCSGSASLILSPSRRSMNFLAAKRSPPATVLFLANLSGGGVGDGDGKD